MRTAKILYEDRTMPHHSSRHVPPPGRTGYRVVSHFLFLTTLLSLLFAACAQNNDSTTQNSTPTSAIAPYKGCDKPTNDVTCVTVDRSASIVTSQFSPGISHIDDSLSTIGTHNDPTAMNNVRSLIKQGIPYQNTFIMAWGAPDPWPDPAQDEPTNWDYIDARLQLIKDTGGIPIISLSEAPWWMKGQLQPDGSTRTLQESEEWNDIGYSSRILDNKMDVWLHLVQRTAERYMVPPYNVRYFQVWNELKGYFNPATNTYDFSVSPGDPNGDNARHGFTFMYNQVYARLMQVATKLGIPNDTIKVGGPYVPLSIYGSKMHGSLSNFSQSYGTFDQRPLDVIQYWLQHKTGAGFITLDAGNNNDDKVNLRDPLVAAQVFADVTQWIRHLDNNLYPGVTTLPIWWAEWYAFPYGNTQDVHYDDAIKSYAMSRFIKAGGAVALEWGGLSNANSDTGLWTPTNVQGGGQPRPWYNSYKAFKDDFSPGTRILKTTVSGPGNIEVLASSTHAMLINMTDKSLTVGINGSGVPLTSYQVRIINL
jgi:hypothetical protein